MRPVRLCLVSLRLSLLGGLRVLSGIPCGSPIGVFCGIFCGGFATGSALFRGSRIRVGGIQLSRFRVCVQRVIHRAHRQNTRLRKLRDHRIVRIPRQPLKQFAL